MAVLPSASYSLTIRLRARAANDEMKVSAARAIAACVGRGELSEEYIIPSVFNKNVAPAVAEGVARAAHATGVARRRRRRLDFSPVS
jgi:malate dehydrogenase (oxaloacetate-decarboxylating)